MKKRLTKSKDNVVLTGSLAGIAEYFNIDPTIVRIFYVAISFMGFGSPVLVYILLAIFIPAADTRSSDHGQNNKYYRNNDYRKSDRPRKEAEKVDEDDWSDF